MLSSNITHLKLIFDYEHESEYEFGNRIYKEIDFNDLNHLNNLVHLDISDVEHGDIHGLPHGLK